MKNQCIVKTWSKKKRTKCLLMICKLVLLTKTLAPTTVNASAWCKGILDNLIINGNGNRTARLASALSPTVCRSMRRYLYTLTVYFQHLFDIYLSTFCSCYVLCLGSHSQSYKSVLLNASLWMGIRFFHLQKTLFVSFSLQLVPDCPGPLFLSVLLSLKMSIETDYDDDNKKIVFMFKFFKF